MLGGLVDPRVLWQAWRLRPEVEPLGVLCVGAVEGGLSSCADVGCGSSMEGVAYSTGMWERGGLRKPERRSLADLAE